MHSQFLLNFALTIPANHAAEAHVKTLKSPIQRDPTNKFRHHWGWDKEVKSDRQGYYTYSHYSRAMTAP